MLWNGPNLWIMIAGVQMIILVVIILYLIFLGTRFRKIRRMFNDLMNGATKGNVERVMEQWLERLHQSEQNFSGINDRLSIIDDAIRMKKGNVGMVRFNAFANEGSDMSFSIAFLDDSSNGFVMTSIFGREESRVYAKPLEGGLSKYHLTEEEKKAIDIAQKKV
jgi:hypothetical protein